MIVFAVAGLLADHTSEDNERTYYPEITKAMYAEDAK